MLLSVQTPRAGVWIRRESNEPSDNHDWELPHTQSFQIVATPVGERLDLFWLNWISLMDMFILNVLHYSYHVDIAVDPTLTMASPPWLYPRKKHQLLGSNIDILLEKRDCTRPSINIGILFSHLSSTKELRQDANDSQSFRVQQALPGVSTILLPTTLRLLRTSINV